MFACKRKENLSLQPSGDDVGPKYVPNHLALCLKTSLRAVEKSMTTQVGVKTGMSAVCR